MDKHVLDKVSEQMLRDASGDPSALTAAQRAERDGFNDPEPYCECTGPMDERPDVGPFIIRDIKSGKYRAYPSNESSYTTSLLQARKFPTRSIALSEACDVCEEVVDIG